MARIIRTRAEVLRYEVGLKKFNPTYKKDVHIRYIYKSHEECSKNASREIFALKDLSFGIYLYRYEAEIFIESIWKQRSSVFQ